MMQNEKWIILALARGAVPMADVISKAFGLEYDLLIMGGIYAPNNDECEIAKVSETEEIVIHQNLVKSFGISLDYIYGEAKRNYEDNLINCQYTLRKSAPLLDVKNRNVLLLDEGCETGLRTVCALKSVLALGAKKVSLATPVIADDLYHQLEMRLDEIFTTHKMKDFIEVDYYYETLEPLAGKVIRKNLEESAYYLPYMKEKTSEL
jgi:putative phosphoribosyl transferase